LRINSEELLIAVSCLPLSRFIGTDDELDSRATTHAVQDTNPDTQHPEPTLLLQPSEVRALRR